MLYSADPWQVEAYVVTANISAVLRGYQQEGINWLGFLLRYDLNRASIKP